MDTLKRRLRGWAARHHAQVLTYHSVLPVDPPVRMSQHMSAATFAWQMAELAANFRCVSLSTLIAELRNGEIAPYTVSVTFDDGYANNLSVALPVLAKHRIPATVFLTAGYVGQDWLLWPERLGIILAATRATTLTFDTERLDLGTAQARAASYVALTRAFKGRTAEEIEAAMGAIAKLADVPEEAVRGARLYGDMRFMTWGEMRELVRSDLIEIGSHTLTHRRLTTLAPEEARKEIQESKRRIERELGTNVRWFAYPFGGRGGDFNDMHRQYAVAAGYDAVFAASGGALTAGADRHELPRVYIGSDMDQAAFRYHVHGGAALGDHPISEWLHSVFR
jgi:peptidoglycan/xylan/chitin deacetylase (PgdA/CDA1 family)